MIRASLMRTVAAVLLVPLSGAVLAQTNFMTQEGSDIWRASKLSGVAVYGPDNRKVGNISDVLMDHSGKATAVVIGVGGFLGIGQKDVAVPYDQVHFTDQPMAPASGSPAPAVEAQTGTTADDKTPVVGLGVPAITPVPGVAPNGGISTNTAVGLGGTGGASNTAAGGLGMATPARTVAEDVRSTAYPDHGMIDLTSDQLKSAPSFQFAK